MSSNPTSNDFIKVKPSDDKHDFQIAGNIVSQKELLSNSERLLNRTQMVVHRLAAILKCLDHTFELPLQANPNGPKPPEDFEVWGLLIRQRFIQMDVESNLGLLNEMLYLLECLTNGTSE